MEGGQAATEHEASGEEAGARLALGGRTGRSSDIDALAGTDYAVRAPATRPWASPAA